MKKILKVSLILSLLVTSLFAGTMEENLNKVFDFLDDGIVKGIAGLLLVSAGGILAFGNVEKGKVQLWCVVIGISIVYGAKTIADALF
jgi:type IV secretory pathway VirB2 component (pilin)